jgi:hypothetical protein
MSHKPPTNRPPSAAYQNQNKAPNYPYGAGPTVEGLMTIKSIVQHTREPQVNSSYSSIQKPRAARPISAVHKIP